MVNHQVQAKYVFLLITVSSTFVTAASNVFSFTVTKTFTAGGERVQCLSVSNEDDQMFEDDTTFTVTLSSTQSRVTATDMTTVTIMDNDGVNVLLAKSKFIVDKYYPVTIQ